MRDIDVNAITRLLADSAWLSNQLQRAAAFRQPDLYLSGDLCSSYPAVKNILRPTELVLQRNKELSGLRSTGKRLSHLSGTGGIKFGLAHTPKRN